MDLGLKGRSVLITGGSQGIGFAVAHALAAEGCGPIHLVARTAADLDACARALTADYGVEVATHALDLSVSENVVAQDLPWFGPKQKRRRWNGRLIYGMQM